MSFLLTLLIAIPVLALLVLVFVGKNNHGVTRLIALVSTLISLGLSIVVWLDFDPTVGTLQMVETYSWISKWNVNFTLGVDGISLPMVMLTSLLMPFAVFMNWRDSDRSRGLSMSLLGLQAALTGAFLADDLVLFYLFFEAMLIPAWIAIGLYGENNRIRTAMTFFIYTLVGGFSLLIAILWLGNLAGTFSIKELSDVALGDDTTTKALFWLFFLAFAIKLPLLPFHSWQAESYANAPISVAIIVAAVMGKVGAYGLLRLNVGMLETTTSELAGVVAVLAVLGITIGAVIAAVQKDLRRLVAFSSLAHLGFIALGIFAGTYTSMSGAVVQMFNHGITTAALFMLISWLIETSGTDRIGDHSGIFKNAPTLAGFFLFTVMASIALPGLNGFPGEFSILVGSFATLPVLTGVAATGVILAAVYFLWAYQRAFFGPVEGNTAGIEDLSVTKRLVFIPLIIAMLVFGVFPNFLTSVINETISTRYSFAAVSQVEGE